MNVLNLEALQAAKAEKRKAETLEKMAACLAAVHYSNIDYVSENLLAITESYAIAYRKPNKAAEWAERKNKKALPVRQH